MANVIRIIYVLYVFWFFKGDQFENSSKGMRIEIMASTVTGVFLIILSVTVVTVLIKKRLDVVFTTENVITYFISDYLKIQAVVPNFPTVSLGKMYNMWHFFFNRTYCIINEKWISDTFSEILFCFNASKNTKKKNIQLWNCHCKKSSFLI